MTSESAGIDLEAALAAREDAPETSDNIVAVTTDLDESGIVVLAATYNAESDEWSPYRRTVAIATPEETAGAIYTSSLAGATTTGDTAYALVRATYQFASGEQIMRYAFASLEGPDGELSATEIQTEQFPGIMFAPVAPIAHDGKIYVLGAVGGGRYDPSASYVPHAYTVDPASGALGDLGAIEGVSDWAADGVSWAVGEGYLRGIGGTSELRPQGCLERAGGNRAHARRPRGIPLPGAR